MGETGRVSRVPDPRWRGQATKLVVTGMVLAWIAAGCSSPSAATAGPVTSCYVFAARAIQRHVTVTAMPAACQGLSQVEVNVAVSRALRAAAAGVHGKVRQRQVIARDSPYVAGLIRVIPASGPPAAAASPSRPSAGPSIAASPSRPPSREALGLAALVSWLVTAGLGGSMMARWITRALRPSSRPGHGQRPVLNLAHFGLALTGLLAWISYLATGVTGLAWAACGLVLAVASLGITLVFLGPANTATGPRPGNGPAPAGQPPVFVVAAHITVACVTILLVTLAAIGTG